MRDTLRGMEPCPGPKAARAIPKLGSMAHATRGVAVKHDAVLAMLCLAMGAAACSFTLPVAPSEPSQRTRTAAKKCANVSGRWFYLVLSRQRYARRGGRRHQHGHCR